MTPRRCPSRHPIYSAQVRCEERVGHLNEQRPHFHSFYMRSWDDDDAAPILSPATRRALAGKLPVKELAR